MLLEVIILNAVVYGIAAGSVLLIGETVPWKEISLLHLAYFLLQIELAGICFGISAFLKRSGIGIGIGIAVMMYFLNLIANISERAEFLKYITPFGYTEGADLVTDLALDAKLVLLGMAFAAAGVTAGFVKYCKKDIC